MSLVLTMVSVGGDQNALCTDTDSSVIIFVQIKSSDIDNLETILVVTPLIKL